MGTPFSNAKFMRKSINSPASSATTVTQAKHFVFGLLDKFDFQVFLCVIHTIPNVVGNILDKCIYLFSLILRYLHKPLFLFFLVHQHLHYQCLSWKLYICFITCTTSSGGIFKNNLCPFFWSRKRLHIALEFHIYPSQKKEAPQQRYRRQSASGFPVSIQFSILPIMLRIITVTSIIYNSHLMALALIASNPGIVNHSLQAAERNV